DNVHVPVPLLVTVPVPVPIILATLPLPEPPNVRAKPDPAIVPAFVTFMSPALVTILTPVLPRVINPLYETFVAELFVIAPPAEIPVPFKVSASAVPSVKPFKSRAAPEATVVPAAVVPSGV